jgi:hypothetical protein
MYGGLGRVGEEVAMTFFSVYYPGISFIGLRNSFSHHKPVFQSRMMLHTPYS